MTAGAPTTTITTRRLRLGGQVQGVGFRPFVRRCAQQLGITGSVCNFGGEVEIIAQGSSRQLEQFIKRLLQEPPPLARPQRVSEESLSAPPYAEFTILASRSEPNPSIHLPADQPLCNDCLHELNNPADRRYRYPFINCTQCGPRFTLIAHLPYDRANTSMALFPLCAACASEYHDINSRRYHAEPIACPECGPQLRFVSADGACEGNTAALGATIAALRNGAIVAVKGIGGYHLLCDARSEAAVMRLRQRKQRARKPLAVMFPWQGPDGLNALQGEVVIGTLEQGRLLSTERPIVLCKRDSNSTLARAIAPALNEIGVLLPYSPLHHLLLEQFGGPLVATSGNLSGEPVLTDDDEATRRLRPIADAFLHHNRPILRPADDSVYRPIAGATRPLRLGRGTTPLELALPRVLEQPVVAVGAHLKNNVALAWEDRIVVSQHIGDLGSPRGMATFAQVIDDLQHLYGVAATRVICDAHPDYASSRWAHTSGLPVDRVLHHHAHASALYGEHYGNGEWLVFTWDGSGYGGEHTLWGGESFIGMPGRWRRFASLLPFHLPGGERAAHQPWRSALALCWEAGRDWPQPGIDTSLLQHAWQQGLNTPASSAVGRLFDGAAALLGLCHDTDYEGEAAMQLEAQAASGGRHAALPLIIGNEPPWLIDWQPLLPLLLDEESTTAHKAGAFHQILADTIVALAQQARAQHAINQVGLTGGVFQNRRLTELCYEQLHQHGFAVTLARRIPCNDGGIACGQVIEHLYRQERST